MQKILVHEKDMQAVCVRRGSQCMDESTSGRRTGECRARVGAGGGRSPLRDSEYLTPGKFCEAETSEGAFSRIQK